jgi:hypothetical protein
MFAAPAVFQVFNSFTSLYYCHCCIYALFYCDVQVAVSKLSVYYNTPASATTSSTANANLPPSGKAKRGATTATAATSNSSKASSTDASTSASISADLTTAVPGTLIAGGHCKGELWGLAVHPSQPQFVTCGDDATLRYVLQSYRFFKYRKFVCNSNAKPIVTSGLSACTRLHCYSSNCTNYKVHNQLDNDTGY